MPIWTARFRNIRKSSKALLYSDNENDSRRFFWLYYKPLIFHLHGVPGRYATGK
ncbi:MAG: hypothetical protein U5L72_19035 [Bacteroidales bacterium]|nr:hypothetical protein [Bacteroidales bacterium]